MSVAGSPAERLPLLDAYSRAVVSAAENAGPSVVLARQQRLARDSGVEVASLAESGPAAAAGVLAGDVIVALGGAEIAELDDLQRALAEATAGEPLPLLLLRRGERRQLVVMPREA